MRITSNKIKDIVAFFKQELIYLYDDREIRSFIFIIMEEYTGYSASQLLTNEEKTVSESTLLKINFAVKALKNYKPLQYIVGHTFFYDLLFKVNPDVLIPRPETEELVKWVIDENKDSFDIDVSEKNLNKRLLDIGTGSGCIAVAIKKRIPEMKVEAIDISPYALRVAQRNAVLNEVDVKFFEHDVFDSNLNDISHKFDVIVSNPPYVRESEKALMSENVLNHEPELALYVEDDQALKYYEAIADFALLKLKHNGVIYLEINEALAEETIAVFIEKGFKKGIIKKDIHNKDRMLKIFK